MQLAYTDEQEALRSELRDYYDRLLTPEVREALHEEEGVGRVHREIIGQMARDGWMGIGWPTEYGGRL